MKFSQKQAQLMYNQLKRIERWLVYNAEITGVECEELDKLGEIRETLKVVDNG